jgi:hypothetical protein
MTPEGKIQSNVVEYARGLGVLVVRINQDAHRGWPDRMFLKNGGIVFIEFKAPGEKPTLIQDLIHEQLRDQGFAVVVVDNISEGRIIIDELAKTCPDV